MGFALDDKPPRFCTDAEIIGDMFQKLSLVLRDGGWKIQKVTKRRSFNQAVYAVAKKFGHRSSYRDLELWVPGMTPALPFHGLWIPLPGLAYAEMYMRLMILGRESQKGATGTSTKDRLSGNTAMANQVEIDVRRDRQVAVQMDLTAPAFYNLCNNAKPKSKGRSFEAGRSIRAKLVEKWGAENTTYGMYNQNTAFDSNEGYKVVRKHDGVPVTHVGMGVISNVPLPGLGSHPQHSQVGQMMGGHRRG